MRKKKAVVVWNRTLVGIVLLQLVLVALGAASQDPSDLNYVGRALHYYGQLSGTFFDYGFFAPGVNGQMRARFEITDPNGNRREVSLLDGASKEADLRIGNVLDQFTTVDPNQMNYQRALAASLAGTVFGRSPDARRVKVYLEEFSLVSMEEYRRGARHSWKTLYTVDFAKTLSPNARTAE